MAIVDTRMTAANLATAKLQVFNVVSQGGSVTLIKPGTKDNYGEVLDESTLSLKTFPVRFSPFTRAVTNMISWAEKVDVIFYCSMLELDNLPLTIEPLKQYIKLRYKGKDYDLEYISEYSAFADSFLYVVIGGTLGS